MGALGDEDAGRALESDEGSPGGLSSWADAESAACLGGKILAKELGLGSWREAVGGLGGRSGFPRWRWVPEGSGTASQPERQHL